MPDGVWLSGRMMGTSGPDRVQVVVDQPDEGTASGLGFGGAGVVDAASGAVIGIGAAQQDLGALSAFAIPIEAVAWLWPPMDDLLSGPAQRLAPPDQRRRVTELVEALLRIPSIADPAGRREMLYLLPPDMSSMIDWHSASRLDVVAIVQACLRYPDSLAKLVEVVGLLEGDSPAALEFEHLAARIPQDLGIFGAVADRQQPQQRECVGHAEVGQSK